MYNRGDVTPCNMVLDDWNLPRCWDQVLEQSNFYEKKKQIDEFNRSGWDYIENEFELVLILRKCGISVLLYKFDLLWMLIFHVFLLSPWQT